jgi:hypothetical protein
MLCPLCKSDKEILLHLLIIYLALQENWLKLEDKITNKILKHFKICTDNHIQIILRNLHFTKA